MGLGNYPNQPTSLITAILLSRHLIRTVHNTHHPHNETQICVTMNTQHHQQCTRIHDRHRSHHQSGKIPSIQTMNAILDDATMWTGGTHPTKLLQSFKRVVGTVTDGTVSQFKKIPSTPLIVTLQVNGKSIDAMIDTGSSTTIITRTLLYKLIHRPRIKYKRNTYRTASNTNLWTIGLVQLKVNIEDIPTFVLAEISTDLCTELVLGNDWITANGIDIITTQRHIRKCNGS